MKILVLTHFYYPHIGGVEKHVREISKSLKVKGESIKIVTEKYNSKLKDHEKIDGIDVYRIKFPKTKFLGLLAIWLELFKLRKLISESDIIHIHDVFIWFLPFRFLFPFKKVVTTIHGLEWVNPLSKISIFQKKLAVLLSNKTVGIGKFLEKYIGVKFDLISYGGAEKITSLRQGFGRQGNSYVYVGRLEENTGLLEFLKFAKKRHLKIDFCGDGVLKQECAKYGVVHGFCDPTPYLKKAEYCVAGGYLAALEGLSYGCKLKLFWNNQVKKDYWQMSPFTKKNVKVWAKSQTWEKLANEYISLYNS